MPEKLIITAIFLVAFIICSILYSQIKKKNAEDPEYQENLKKMQREEEERIRKMKEERETQELKEEYHSMGSYDDKENW